MGKVSLHVRWVAGLNLHPRPMHFFSTNVPGSVTWVFGFPFMAHFEKYSALDGTKATLDHTQITPTSIFTLKHLASRSEN